LRHRCRGGRRKRPCNMYGREVQRLGPKAFERVTATPVRLRTGERSGAQWHLADLLPATRYAARESAETLPRSATHTGALALDEWPACAQAQPATSKNARIGKDSWRVFHSRRVTMDVLNRSVFSQRSKHTILEHSNASILPVAHSVRLSSLLLCRFGLGYGADSATRPGHVYGRSGSSNMMDQLGIKALRPGPSGTRMRPTTPTTTSLWLILSRPSDPLTMNDGQR